MDKKKRLSQKERRNIVESVIGKVPWNKFESGIYNYCDRWCEKCNKTNRCYLLFEDQKDRKELIKQGKNPNDIKSAMMIAGKSFKKTIDLIRKISEAEDVDISITKEDKKKFNELKRKIDHSKSPLYKKANSLFLEIHDWLKTTPSLDFDDYREEYDKLSWHHLLIGVKVARSITSKKESEFEKGWERKCSLDDSNKSGWVAYRSTKICKRALEFMDQFVGDFRIQPMIKKCDELVTEIDNNLL